MKGPLFVSRSRSWLGSCSATGRRIALLALPLAAALGLSLGCARSPYGDFSHVPDRRACELEVSLPNMACEEACPVKVRGALGSVAGVRRVDVDYAGKSASVSAVYPACSRAGYEQMMGNLYAQGYKARIVSSRPLMGWEQ